MAEEKEPTLKDLFIALKKGNAETQKKLENIEILVATNQKTLQDYIKSNDEQVKGLQTRVKKLEDTVTSLEATVNTLSGNIMELIKAEANNKKILIKLEKAEKQIEEDRRKANIIIDGLKESKKEHPSAQVTSLLEEIGVKMKPECILTASRLGPVTDRNSRRPRNILVEFASPFWKQEIFWNIHKSKDSDKWNGIHIQDDLSQEIIEQRRELRCLAALAKEKGHHASTRGGAIIIDEQRYSGT